MKLNVHTSVLAALAPLALITTAAAETTLTGPSAGYTFFNRPGATIEDHNTAVLGCHELVQDVRVNRRSTTTSGPAGGWGIATAATVDAIANVTASRRTYTAGVENCMVVRGWRVVRMAQPAGVALDAQPAAAIREHLSMQVGAETPQGEVVRTFNNDMMIAGTVWSGRPQDLDIVSLSIQATALPRANRDDDDVALPRQPRTAQEPLSRRPRGAARFRCGSNASAQTRRNRRGSQMACLRVSK
ncbi:MAG: hypothetical protein NT015_04925 [Alphaproteobacteria bacterium]|nr:hypothetical protein [Alphaproteobacteria bacterium]